MKKSKAELEQAIKDFWKAFKEAHNLLIDNDNVVNEAIYSELSDKLKDIHENLCLEVDHNRTPYQLIISADGLDDVFEFVEMVGADKPKIPGWEVIKYRQHRDDIEEQTVTIGDQTLALSEIFFDLVIDEEAGIVVVMFIPGFDEENDAHEMLRWVILDNTIGEYNAVKKVGYFATYSTAAMKDLGKKMTDEFKTLSHLKKDLDILWKEYNTGIN